MRCDLPCAIEEGQVARLVDKTEATEAWEKDNPPSLVLTVWVAKDGRTLNRAAWAPDVTDAVKAAHSGEVDVAAIVEAMSMASLSAMLLADAMLKTAAKEARMLPAADEAAASA